MSSPRNTQSPQLKVLKQVQTTRFLFISNVYYYIYGFVTGLIFAPFKAISEARSNEDQQSSPKSLLGDITNFFKTLFTFPFEIAQNKKNDFEKKCLNSKLNTNPENAQSTTYGSMLLFGFLGFIVGLVVAPLTAITYILNTRNNKTKDEEAFLYKLISAPFRFVKVLLIMPFLIAKNYAVGSALSKKNTEDSTSTQSKKNTTKDHKKEPSSITSELNKVFILPAKTRLAAYLKLVFYGIAGFILGFLEAPIKFIQDMIDENNKPNNLSDFFYLMISFIIALPLIPIVYFLENPFNKMILWMQRSLEETQKKYERKIELNKKLETFIEENPTELSPISYLRVGLYWLIDMVAACIEAPIIAIRYILEINHEESLLASIVKAPFRFIGKLLTYPWNLTNVAWEKEKLLEHNRVKLIEQRFTSINRRQLNTFSEYLAGFVKGTFGLIVGLISFPAVALHHLATAKVVVKNEHFFETLLKLPLRVFDVITFPFETARNFAKPSLSTNANILRNFFNQGQPKETNYEDYVTQFAQDNKANELEKITDQSQNQSFDAPIFKP